MKKERFFLLMLILVTTFFIFSSRANADQITVDFDALDTSAGWVSGATLDSYLAGYGVTLTNLTPSSTVAVGNQSIAVLSG